MERQLTLSTTVQGAHRKLSARRSIPAILLANEVLRTHMDYVREHLNDIKKELQNWTYVYERGRSSAKNDDTERHVDRWIEDVRELFDESLVRELHGRNVIIGLSLLDGELRKIISQHDFLKKLIAELKENIETILTRKGKELYDTLIKAPVISETDYVDTQPDNPVKGDKEDKLDRYYFADFLTKLLNNTNLNYGAYALHIFAPWGAGKTSVFNFMKDIMGEQQNANGKPRWVGVDFNAWQNQHLTYPWWTLMNTIYKSVKKHLPWRYRLHEWWLRFGASKLPYLIGIVVLAWLIVFLIVPLLSSKDSDTTGVVSKTFENIDKLVAGILAVWAFVVGVSRNFFSGSQKEAESFMSSKDDPMEVFKKRFQKLVQALQPTNLIIFIDDLDRCKSDFVVKILENIQTLFKEAHVVFVIAADKKWIHACYEVEYDKMKGYVGVEGKTIGPLFVEKMFQLSVPLPGVHPSLKEKFWESILGIESKSAALLDKETIENIAQAGSVQARENIIKQAAQQDFGKNHATRLELLKTLANKSALQQTEHLLKPYSTLLDLNPRGMKRLLNSYSVNKASSMISHIDVEPHQLVLWTILSMRWPMLSEFITDYPVVIDKEVGEPAVKIPEHIKALLADAEVKDVLNGGKTGSPLTKETVEKCRMLSL